MSRSPIYDAINMFSEPSVKQLRKKIVVPKTDRANKALFEHLTFINEPRLEDFIMLSSMNGGAAFIAKVLNLSLGTVQQMKYAGYTQRYYKRYLEARAKNSGTNVS